MNQSQESRRRSTALVFVRAALVSIVLVTFWPVIGHDFGGWDDEMNVAANARLLPPTLESLAHYWTHFEADLYVPATYTVWAAVARFAYAPATALSPRPSLNPHDFHSLNLALHVVAALAALEILRRCVTSAPAAGAGALLFAVHPLQVEPVAWIAGMKDVLAGTLALVAIWQYLAAAEADQHGGRRALHWIIGTIAFVLAMLSKPNTVVTPAIAWLIDRLVIGRSFRDATRRALPWLAIAIPCIVWTKLAQPAAAIGGAVPLSVRPLVATDAIAFYLWKLGWPVNLAVDYGRTPQRAIAHRWLFYTWLFPAALGAISLLAFRLRGTRICLAALAILVVALLQVLGLVPFDFQAYSTVADHYMYLAMLGPGLAIAWLLDRNPTAISWTIAAIGLVALVTLSRMQTRHWRDAVAIFEHAVRVNPQSWAAHNTLSFEYTRRGEFDRALARARDAVASNPDAVLARFSLAAALANAGQTDDAIAAYQDLIAREPNHVRGRLQLSSLLEEQGKRGDAIEQYRAVLRIDPQNAQARDGVARLTQGVP